MFDAALEALESPAFVLRRSGTVMHSNAAGRAWLAHDRARRLGELHDAILAPSRRGPVRVTEIAMAPKRFLVVCRPSADAAAWAPAAARWRLSAREAQVLALLADGLANQAIAAELGIAERTVETHLASMFAKANVATRLELVAKALRA
jgi:DNA-binding CsgD family transcriptional regulator